MVDGRDLDRVLLRRYQVKSLLGRTRRSWGEYITMDLQEMGWEGMDWIDLAQDRYKCQALVNAVINFRVT
jgi:hypothetical protein